MSANLRREGEPAGVRLRAEGEEEVRTGPGARAESQNPEPRLRRAGAESPAESARVAAADADPRSPFARQTADLRRPARRLLPRSRPALPARGVHTAAASAVLRLPPAAAAMGTRSVGTLNARAFQGGAVADPPPDVRARREGA